MHKLTNVEAQRVMAVLGETLDRLNYLSYIPNTPDWEMLEQLSEGGCQEVSVLVQQQWQLEESHTVINRPQGDDATHGALKGTRSDTPAALEVHQQLQASTRALCRGLRNNPVAVEVLYHSSRMRDRSDQMVACLQSLSELTDLTFRKLSTTVEDEEAQKTRLREVTDREEEAEEGRKLLGQQLHTQRQERNREMATLDQTRSKLRGELQDITHNSHIETQQLEAETKEFMDKATADHGARLLELKAQLERLQQEAISTAAEHDEIEAQMRKRKVKVEGEVQSWVEQYDRDMEKKRVMAEKMSNMFKKETVQLQELEEHFNKVDAENARIESEESVIAQIKAKQDAKQKVLDDAAIRFQAIFRGHKARMEYKKLMSKSKKGKKGGKKGKKK